MSLWQPLQATNGFALRGYSAVLGTIVAMPQPMLFLGPHPAALKPCSEVISSSYQILALVHSTIR
jgi:hypothetical protein